MLEECFYISFSLWPFIWFCGRVQTETPCSAAPAFCQACSFCTLGKILVKHWGVYPYRSLMSSVHFFMTGQLPWITWSLLSWNPDFSSATFLSHFPSACSSHWWSLQLRQTSAIAFPSSTCLPVCNMSSRNPVLLGLSGISGKKMSPGYSLWLLTPLHICSSLSTHQDIWSARWQSRPAVVRWLLVVWMKLHALPLSDHTAHSRHPPCLFWCPLQFWPTARNCLLAWFIARLHSLMSLFCFQFSLFTLSHVCLHDSSRFVEWAILCLSSNP